MLIGQKVHVHNFGNSGTHSGASGRFYGNRGVQGMLAAKSKISHVARNPIWWLTLELIGMFERTLMDIPCNVFIIFRNWCAKQESR